MTDVRIFIGGLAAWLGVIVSVLLTRTDSFERARYALIISVLVACLGVVLLRSAGIARTVGVVMICAGIAGSAAAVQTRAWSDPVVSAALSSSPVQVVGVVSGEAAPMPLSPFSEGERWRVPVTMSRIIDSDSQMTSDLPITLVLEQPTSIIPGTVIAVSGRMKVLDGDVRTLGYFTVREGPEVIEAAGPINRVAAHVRAGLRHALAPFPVAGASLVAGLAVGDESALPESLAADMRTSGLAHLTAVSGGNVAIVIGAAIVVAMVLRRQLFGRVVLALCALGLYVVVVSPEPSVVRAAVMGSIVVIGVLAGGRRAGPAVLGTAVLIIAITAPYLAMTWGFALSVCAASGIIIVAPRLFAWIINRWQIPYSSQRWSRVNVARIIIAACCVTVSASAFTAPVLLAMGASVGVVTIPANLLAMPVVPIITIAGLLAAVTGSLFVPLGSLFAAVAFVPAAFIAWLAQMSAQWPLPRIESWTELLVIVLVISVLVAAFRWVQSSWGRVGIGFVTLVAFILWWWAPSRGWPPANWFLVMCDVGQGDALLLRSNDHIVMVDVGGDDGKADTCLRDLGISHLDALIITHFHADHAGGVASTLHGRTVDAVYATPVQDPPEQFDRFQERLTSAGVPWFTVTAGAQMKVPGMTMWVMWPRYFIRESAANNSSVVVWTEVAHTSIVLTGDVEPEAQRAFMADLGPADVVKVPHHGSRFQEPDLATFTHPQIALISVGADNDYGHPAPSTMEQWQQVGARILRTDLHGTVALSRSSVGGPLTITARGMLSPP